MSLLEVAEAGVSNLDVPFNTNIRDLDGLRPPRKKVQKGGEPEGGSVRKSECW